MHWTRLVCNVDRTFQKPLFAMSVIIMDSFSLWFVN